MPFLERELIAIVSDKEEKLDAVKKLVEQGVDLAYYSGNWNALHYAVRSGHNEIVSYFLKLFKSYKLEPPSSHSAIQLIVSSKQHQSLKWAPNFEIVKLIAPYLIIYGEHQASYKYALSLKSDEIQQFLKDINNK